MGLGLLADSRHRPREEVRRSRILSEQRRRNELREGFERLREALPPSNQRTSKANILDRGEFGSGVRIADLSCAAYPAFDRST